MARLLSWDTTSPLKWVSDRLCLYQSPRSHLGSENFGIVTKNVPDRPIMYCSIPMISSFPPPPSLAYKFLKPCDPAKSSDRSPSGDKFWQVPNWLLSYWLLRLIESTLFPKYSLSDILTDNTGKENRRGFFSQYSIFSGQFTNESATTEHLLFLSRPQSGMGSIRDTTWCSWHLD